MIVVVAERWLEEVQTFVFRYSHSLPMEVIPYIPVSLFLIVVAFLIRF